VDFTIDFSTDKKSLVLVSLSSIKVLQMSVAFEVYYTILYKIKYELQQRKMILITILTHSTNVLIIRDF